MVLFKYCVGSPQMISTANQNSFVENVILFKTEQFGLDLVIIELKRAFENKKFWKNNNYFLNKLSFEQISLL